MAAITKGRFVCVRKQMGTHFLILRTAGGGQQVAEGIGRSCETLGRQCAGQVVRKMLKRQKISF